MSWRYYIIDCTTPTVSCTNDTEKAEEYMDNSDYSVIDTESNQFSNGDGSDMLIGIPLLM